MSALQAVLSQISLAAVFAGLLVLALASRLRPAWLLPLAPLVPAALYLWNPNLRVYSSHGLAHASIVYEILNGRVPPECSIMAGEPLLYFWGHHLLVAVVSWVLRVTPFTGFALVNTAAFGATAYLMYRIGRFLGGTASAGVLSAALGTCGATIPHYGFLFKPLELLTGLTVHDLRAPIPVQKFTNLNSMGLGFAFFALFLYATVRIFGDERPTRTPYVLLVLSVLGSGFFYPLAWLVVMPGCFAAAGLVYLRSRGAAFQRAFRSLLLSCLATLLLVPYFYEIGHGKSAALVRLLPDIGFAASKLTFLLMLISLAVAVLAWQRDALRRAFERHPDGLLVLVASALTGALMFVVVAMWNLNEYKFLMVCISSVGLITAIGMDAVQRSHKLITFGILSLFLVTFAADTLTKADVASYRVADPYLEEGMFLHHRDPEEDELYQWISSRTPTDAVFVDSKLTIPVFGRRQLYVGLTGAHKAPRSAPLNGWKMTAAEMLEQWFGYAPERIQARTEVARDLLASDGADIGVEEVQRLRDTTHTREVFVVSRTEGDARRLAQSPAFQQVFQNGKASVFQLRRSGPEAPDRPQSS